MEQNELENKINSEITSIIIKIKELEDMKKEKDEEIITLEKKIKTLENINANKTND
jgi:hypothetical protein